MLYRLFDRVNQRVVGASHKTLTYKEPDEDRDHPEGYGHAPRFRAPIKSPANLRKIPSATETKKDPTFASSIPSTQSTRP